MEKTRILLVEDDQSIRDFLKITLEGNNYDLLMAKNGNEGLEILNHEVVHIILLDLGLPDIDGMELLEIIRKTSAVPIIIITARNHEKEKVTALDLGADDYITKPFGTQELLARIRSTMRRTDLYEDEKTTMFMIGDLKIDDEKRQIFMQEKDIHLTPIEYKLLLLLAKNSGRVLTHDYLMKIVWGPYVDERQSLRVNMANIRRKIEEDPAQPKYIKTEVGIGYRLIDGTDVHSM